MEIKEIGSVVKGEGGGHSKLKSRRHGQYSYFSPTTYI